MPIKSFLDPVPLYILQVGLHYWFPTESIESTPYPPCYQRILKQQWSISWKNFLWGKLLEKWRCLQQQYCTRRQQTITHSQCHWLTKFICTMRNRIYTLWLAHNHDHHGRTSKAKTLSQPPASSTHHTIPLPPQGLMILSSNRRY
jgi:hypothetical protein